MIVSRRVTYLEALQRGVFRSLGLPLPATDNEWRENFFRQFFDKTGGEAALGPYEQFRNRHAERYESILKSLPTPFEDPALYSVMTTLTTEIQKVLDANSLRLEGEMLFGTLPTGRANAMAISVPGADPPEYLVLFEGGLFGFANLMCKVVAQAFPFKETVEGKLHFSTDEKECLQRIVEREEIFERFLDSIIAYLCAGDPHTAEPYILEHKHSTLTSILRDSMELFVLGHEYGHILSGHFINGGRRSAVIGDEDVTEVSLAWEQEFEADMRGLEIMLAAMLNKGFDLSLGYWGADLFFGCIDIVERGISLLRGEPQSRALSSTHPPTQLRRELLRHFLESRFPPEVSQGPLNLSNVVHTILEDLWARCVPILSNPSQFGLSLAPIWRGV